MKSLKILAILILTAFAAHSFAGEAPKDAKETPSSEKQVFADWSKDPRNAKDEKQGKRHGLYDRKYPPKLEDEKSFTFLVYGDPQNYTKNDINYGIFDAMTTWTAHFKDALNVKAVLCTGDLVERNGSEIVYKKHRDIDRFGMLPSKKQWQAVSRGFARLDGVLPYILAAGNHDYGFYAAENRDSNFPEYFYPERNSTWRDTLVAMGVSSSGKRTMENAAYEFEDNNWGKILVISLEFSPRESSMLWAKKLASKSEYKDHLVVILTHAFLSGKGDILGSMKYKLSEPSSGVDIWNKLIKDTPNIRMVISGHVSNLSSYREETNSFGKKVHMMMFNTQFHAGNGGDGWVRIMEFMPDGKTISMKTYSPLFALSPTTEHMAWGKGPKFEYKIEIEK